MFATLLKPRAELVYVSLRIVAGLAFSFHGFQKIFGVLGATPQEFGTQIWLGGLIELVCGLAIALGFLTSLAAFLASGTMAVAYIQFHWKLQFGAEFFPAVNKGELALLYCFLFLFMVFHGSGPLAVDRVIFKPKT